MSAVSRRRLLLAFPAFAAASRILAAHAPSGMRTARPNGDANVAPAPAAGPIRVRTLNHFGLAVSDPKRTIEFYQGLFGMPIQARSDQRAILRVGAGPQFMSIEPASGAPP